MRIVGVLALALICTTGLSCAGSGRSTPVVKVVKEWGGSVVNISTERTVLLQKHPNWQKYGNFFDDFYKGKFMDSAGSMKLKGIGSGVIVSKDGLIITNAHVVNMASKVYAILPDGGQYEAAVAAVNPRDDLAIIKISIDRELRPVRLAKDVMIGETVVSIGNPLGLENSVSVGVVSGLDRKITQTATGQVILDNVIQTDASINIGSSGGALLNLDGELVGINFAVVQGAQSVGFAISFDKIQRILGEYAAYIKKKKLGSPTS